MHNTKFNDRRTGRTAAEHYGIEVKRNGMACCPFHDDRTPSMKVDKSSGDQRQKVDIYSAICYTEG